MTDEPDDDSISHYYNEDFEPDSEDEAVTKKEKKKSSLKTMKGRHLGRSFSDTQAALTGKKLKRNTVDKPLPPKRNLKNQTEETYVTQRLLSARQHKITELRNEMKNMARQLKEVCDENRFLKQLHARQEKELMRLNTAKSELPNIMESHSQELQAVRKQLKKQKEKNRVAMESTKAKEAEILRLKSELKILNNLCQQKDLMEREELKKKVQSLEQQLSYQMTTSKELSRKLDLSYRLHKQEITAERTRFKQTKDMLDQLQHRCNELNILLKDRELKLERNFIYSHQRDKKIWKNTKGVGIENIIPKQLEKPLSPLPMTYAEGNNNFGMVDEPYNVTESYEDINSIQRNNYWSQITQRERHEVILEGEQLLSDVSKQQLLNKSADEEKKVSEDVEKDYKEDKFLSLMESASTESFRNNGAPAIIAGRSYSSLALTSCSQGAASKEDATLHHSSSTNSLLFSHNATNHSYRDPDGRPKSEQNKIKREQPSLSSTVTEETRLLIGNGIDSALSYESIPSKRQNDSRTSWLPDIFQQSVNLH